MSLRCILHDKGAMREFGSEVAGLGRVAPRSVEVPYETTAGSCVRACSVLDRLIQPSPSRPGDRPRYRALHVLVFALRLFAPLCFREFCFTCVTVRNALLELTVSTLSPLAFAPRAHVPTHGLWLATLDDDTTAAPMNVIPSPTEAPGATPPTDTR